MITQTGRSACIIFSSLFIFLILDKPIWCNGARELFLPDDDQVHLFVGQDLESVGGLEGYDNGYIDYFGMPAGITSYTGISDMDGLNSFTNYGAGDVHARRYLEEPSFDGAMLALGLYMVDDLADTAAGNWDEHLEELAEFIREYGDPVFLRIGYEFNGAHNRYDPQQYVAAFRYVRDFLDHRKVRNYVTVWQADEHGSMDRLLAWYPGDDYVDWLGYSYFNSPRKNIGRGILDIARDRGKPVFIAEATPRIDMMLTDQLTAWYGWFDPFLEHIRENSDVIKAVSYINCRWRTQEMWKGRGWGDSRLQLKEFYQNRWINVLKSGLFNVPNAITAPREYRREKADAHPAGSLVPGEKIEGALEAETAMMMGNVREYSDGYASGGKGAAYIYMEDDRLIFQDMPASTGFLLRYSSHVEEASNGERVSGRIGLYIDNERVGDLVFDSTESWVESYSIIEIQLAIPAGSDFAIGFDEGDTAMNVDYIVPLTF